MHVLAIDTALQACSAAVVDTERSEPLACETHAMARGHAEALLPLVARVMDRSGRDFADLDRIAVTVGPGSFTGLRVGLSAARGLGLAAAIPVVGLSTLAAFAAPHISRAEARMIVAVIDALHGNVYLQVFAIGGRALVAPTLVSLKDAMRAALEAPSIIVGTAAGAMAEAWPDDAAPPVAVVHDAAPDIRWVARLGAAAEEASAPAKPLYLRKPDARPQDAARLARR